MGRGIVAEADFLVIGSGIAGLFTALRLADSGQVRLVTKGALEESNSYYAQGGVAAALRAPDSPQAHLEDTLKAGAGLCDVKPLKVLVREGPHRVRELIDMGVPFDRDGDRIALTREGAHRHQRVAHAFGDATGRAMTDRLAQLVREHEAIEVFEFHTAVDLLIGGGRCYGAVVVGSGSGGAEVQEAPVVATPLPAAATVLATGGGGQIYAETSNPSVATGDGIALAWRAGADLKDMEFVQFHPTVLKPGKDRPRFLLTEALRGEGAVLRNAAGERFMPRYHQLAELAPRDIVARAIWSEMDREGDNCVYLDATAITGVNLSQRFPTVYDVCRQYGWLMEEDPLPVAPAAHYMMGGVKTDERGKTSVPGLFACGEVTCTGIHGANRLASNSLLETLVFGEEAAVSAVEWVAAGSGAGNSPQSIVSPNVSGCHADDPSSDAIGRQNPQLSAATIEGLREDLKRVMWKDAGILRSADSLAHARISVAALRQRLPVEGALSAGLVAMHTVATGLYLKIVELTNMLDVAERVIEAALIREESRGGHYRMDYPDTSETWLKHIVLNKQRGTSFEERIDPATD